MIQLGAMPLPEFVSLHPGARVSPDEIAIVKTYLAPWTPEPTDCQHSARRRWEDRRRAVLSSTVCKSCAPRSTRGR
jgi:hypothetical protein